MEQAQDDDLQAERNLKFRVDEVLAGQLAGLAIVDEVSLEEVIVEGFTWAIEQRRADPQLPEQIAAAKVRLQRR